MFILPRLMNFFKKMIQDRDLKLLSSERAEKIGLEKLLSKIFKPVNMLKNLFKTATSNPHKIMVNE